MQKHPPTHVGRADLHIKHPYLACKLPFKQLKQVEVAKVVGANLALKAILGVAQRARHDSSVADEHINPGLLTELLCKAGHAAEICQVQLCHQDLPLHKKQQEGGSGPRKLYSEYETGSTSMFHR